MIATLGWAKIDDVMTARVSSRYCVEKVVKAAVNEHVSGNGPNQCRAVQKVTASQTRPES